MKVKVKVKKRFVDRDTKQLREVGKEYEYNEERTNDLLKRGYVEASNTNKAKE